MKNNTSFSNSMRCILIASIAILLVQNTFAQKRRGQKTYTPLASVAAIQPYLLEKEKAEKFSGSVLVIQGGEKLLHQAYGYANAAKQKKNNTETKINIGSINKAFTAVAVLQLAEQQKLSLDDKIVDYIPELKMDRADQITIRHLLQMSSGFGFYHGHPKYLEGRKSFDNMEDYLPIIASEELAFEPGTRKQYSNSGYELLGILVQRVSKTDYYDYVRKHIYKKARMKNTDAYKRNGKTKNLALGYTKYEEGDQISVRQLAYKKGKFALENEELHANMGTAAGGGYSTPEDLYKFITAVYENKLLSKKYADLFFNKYSDKQERKQTYRAAGGSLGINAAIFVDFSKENIVIVCTNYDPPTASDAAGVIAKTLEANNENK